MTPPTEDEVRAQIARIGSLAGSWEDGARLLGNMTAKEMADAMRHAIALLDEARKDRERLDWLEASGCYVTTSDVDFTPVPLPNLRAAIDQARGEEKTNG